MRTCCSKTNDKLINKSTLIRPKDDKDESIFGYYNLFPDTPISEPTANEDDDDTPVLRDWIPAGLKDKTLNIPSHPPEAELPSCLRVGVPIVPPSDSSLTPRRRQYIPKPHLARSLPYYKTEKYLLRLPYQPPTRFYRPHVMVTQLTDPSDYIRWMNEMKSKLMQCKAWRILEDNFEPVPPTSGLRPRWDQINHRAWFMILANVSREIRQELCEACAWDVQGSWCYLVRFGRIPSTREVGD